MRAWLITWESAEDSIPPKEHIAAILNPRKSSSQVEQVMEMIYANAQYSLSERLSYANNRKFNPYPAYHDKFQGVGLDYRLYCGHNPWLYGRIVNDIQVKVDDDGEEYLVWTDAPLPDPSRWTRDVDNRSDE